MHGNGRSHSAAALACCAPWLSRLCSGCLLLLRLERGVSPGTAVAGLMRHSDPFGLLWSGLLCALLQAARGAGICLAVLPGTSKR